jgi:hypothetical protein
MLLSRGEATGALDVVEQQVLDVHVGGFSAGVAGMKDLAGCGDQGPQPLPQLSPCGTLRGGQVLERDVALRPQPHLTPVA